ncbi:MAG: hypothetical protein JWM41_3102 [Gemmatimonadetes bacterium]|nr:hypothetical protein [Gemmatimonadota bacterium]
MITARRATFFAAAAFLPALAQAQSPFDSLHFRSIGPAATGGRIHDIEVDPKDPSTMYVAAASGGIWKTTNHGTFWTPVFEGQPDNTFGDLAIFPGDPKIIWAGTGEQNNRQSSSWGTGVYRSNDGGAHWQSLGLSDTRAIGRVVLHPTNSNIAYVAAAGNLWKPNPERGVFKTTDGGRTWNKILYVDTLTGATDLAMDPRDPNVLYAATYQRLRSTFGYNGGGPGSAMYKTTDGGATWKKMENGIPAGDKGRIAFSISASNPNVLIALVEHATESGTYRTEDAGATWKKMSRSNPRPMYFSAPYIDPTNDKRVWELGVTIFKSEDGGATFENMPNSPAYDVGLKTDHHTMWIDPANSRHTLVGGDGGMHESWDLGLTYTRMNNIPIGQFYKIAVDDRDPYWVYGGLQDTHSWMGPSATRHWLGILNQDWKQIGFSDGTGQAVDKAGYRYVYSSSDGGNVQRFDPETGDHIDIKPQPPKGDSAYRWDWDAPLIASRHTAGTVYIGANRLFISKDFGNTWTRTKDLTRSVNRDTLRLMGVLDKDIKIAKNDGESGYSELTTIAESPLDAKVLWVGADDGNIQVSTDGGTTWREVSAGVPGVANGTYVSRIVASSASRGTAYVSFDAHRIGDFAPYIARTTDFGKTWKTITSGLQPDASVRSIQEYPGKANVLFAGTERSLYVSRDSGAQWSRLASNLPTTRYDDIVVQPRTKDLVLATHGRSIWILDDASPIAEWTDAIAAKLTYLFAPKRATLMWYWEDISNTAQGMYAADNPADGAVFTYSLAKAAQKVRLIVRGMDGKVIRDIAGSTSPGVIHRTTWDLRHVPPPATAGAGGGGGGEEGGGPPPEAGAPAGGRSGAGRGRVDAPVQLPIPAHDIGLRGPYVSPGTFKVTLDVDGDTTSRTFEVRGDPALNITTAQQKARETFLLDVQALQVQVEQRAADLRTRRTAAAGEEATRLAALERRLTGRDGVRGKLGGVARGFNGAGAQQGSFAAPTNTQRLAVTEAKAELAAVDKELKK